MITFFRRDILLHVLIGEDDYSIHQALEEIKKSIGDPTALMSNTTILEGKTVTPERLRNACETVPFLAEKRLVIIEGLLECFEVVGRGGRKKTTKPANEPEEYQKITTSLKDLPPFTELVITGGSIRTSNPLLRELVKLTSIKTFPLLKTPQLGAWVEKRVQKLGGKISAQAVTMLVRFVGNDLWTMANEVDKLVLYAGGKSIGEGDVKAVVSNTHEESIFTMVDAVLESRGSAGQQLLQQMLKQGVAPVQVLQMIARQARIIFLVKEMRAKGRTRTEIQSKLGIQSDFVVRKAWDQADKYPGARIRELYHQLLETDIAIKTGRIEGDVALDILVAELGQRGAVSA
jgi:DNA polymerase-3 subunit delta